MSKNYLLNQLAQHMQADLADAIGAQEEEILRAIAKASENGTDSEEPVKFAVTLRGVLNLDANTVETAFSFATRTSVKEKHALEDPKQAKLPLEGVAVSIRTTGPDGEFSDPVTITEHGLRKMRAKVEQTLSDGGFRQGTDGVYRKGETPSAAMKGLDAYEAECERVFSEREADGMFDTRAYKSRKKEGEE